MKIGKKLASNTSYLLLDWAALTFFSLIFWIILGKILEPTEYGIISTSINFAVFLSTFTIMGISSAISKLIPEYLEKKRNRNYVKSLISTSLRPILLSSLIISLFLFLFSSQISGFLKMSMRLYIINIFLLIAISLYHFNWSTIYGFQQMKKIFQMDSTFSISKIIFSVILIYLGFRQFGAVFAILLSYILMILFRFDFTYLKKPTVKIKYREIFFYSFPALIGSVAVSLINNSQYVILTILKNPEITGLFTPAVALSSLLIALPGIINAGLFPIISQLSVERGTKKEQSYLINLVLRYSLLIMIPFATLLLTLSNNFILLYASKLFIQATQYLPILVPAAVLFGIGQIFISNIYAIGKPTINRNIMIFVSSIFLITAIILTNYFSATGLASAFFIIAATFFSLTFYYLRKFLRVRFYKKDIIKIFISSFIIGILALYFKFLLFNSIVFILFSFILGILYFVFLLLLKFYRYEDVRLIEFFIEKLPVFKVPFKILLKLIRKSNNI